MVQLHTDLVSRVGICSRALSLPAIRYARMSQEPRLYSHMSGNCREDMSKEATVKTWIHSGPRIRNVHYTYRLSCVCLAKPPCRLYMTEFASNASAHCAPRPLRSRIRGAKDHSLMTQKTRFCQNTDTLSIK